MVFLNLPIVNLLQPMDFTFKKDEKLVFEKSNERTRRRRQSNGMYYFGALCGTLVFEELRR